MKRVFNIASLAVISVLLVFAIAMPVSSVLSASASGLPVKTDTFYANDQANVLSSATEQLIINYSSVLQQKTGAQIVVLTMKSIGNNVLEDYALNVLRTWGIGDKQKNNGVLILLAVDDHMSRIEVGYGLEGRLPDGKTGRIQDEYMLPYYKNGDYDSGIKNGYLAVLNEVLNEYDINADQFKSTSPQRLPGTEEDFLKTTGRMIFTIIAIILLILDWLLFKGAITRMLLLLLFRNSGRGGFGGGGRSGGGFGGFRGGGGSGGGGGSSRKW